MSTIGLRSPYILINGLIVLLALWTGQLIAEQTGPGRHKSIDAAALFADKCLHCHARPGPWPDVTGMAKLTSKEIYRILSAGLMREIADGLNDAERQAIASYVGGLNPDKPSLESAGLCTSSKKRLTRSQKISANWSGWSLDASNDRHVRDVSLSRSQVEGLKLIWSFVFPDTAPFTSASNQPTVVDGQLFIGNMNGMVYALDAESGCTHWSFKAKAHVRSTIAVSGNTVVFADYETNVYALDSRTGALRWISRADEQPSARVNGNVTLHKGVVFVPISSNQEMISGIPDFPCCSFRGNIVAFEMETGRQLWKTSLIEEPLRELGFNYKGVKRYGPSGIAVWSVPTVDVKRQLLYVTTGNQFTEPRIPESDAVIALDIRSGERRWSKSFVPEQFEGGDIWNSGCETEAMYNETLSTCPPTNPEHEGDREIGAPAVLKTLANGKDVLLVGTKDGVLYSLDPDSDGTILWQIRLSKIAPGRGPILGGIEHGIAVDDKHVYVPIADMAPLLLTAYGSMASIDLETGKLEWQVEAATDTCKGKSIGCNNGYMGAPTVVGQVVFAGSNDGFLRAFDISNGRILWSYDTVRQFTGINGLRGSGGSVSRNGPTIVKGMLYQTSGYGHLGAGMPGNVLLAFKIPNS